MPIEGAGWEFHIIRKEEQKRQGDGRRRTVGFYKVYHDGVAQNGSDMAGMVAETKGPGANFPAENGLRVEAGRYPLWTQDGSKYDTWGYVVSDDPEVGPKPGLELRKTGDRTEILIHPGRGFLSSVGCINPCTYLPNAGEVIDFIGSRERVIVIIENLRVYLGKDFPGVNGKRIPRAFVVIDGEPAPLP